MIIIINNTIPGRYEVETDTGIKEIFYLRPIAYNLWSKTGMEKLTEFLKDYLT